MKTHCKCGREYDVFTGPNRCSACSKERCKRWRNANKEKISEYNKKWGLANVDRKRELGAIWRASHPDRYKEAYTRWNNDPNNRKYKTAMENKRRAAKLRAIVAWSDLTAITKFYADCPQDMTVDHIIPLQGKEVCGLHVLENLQYLTLSENSRKNNRLVTTE